MPSWKAAKKGISTGNELSKFSDTPGDASLEDLFHPLDKNTDDQSSVTSASTSTANPSSAAPDSGKNDLATKLRAAIAQKQMENEMGQANGGNLLRVMIRALKEDVIDIDSSLVCLKRCWYHFFILSRLYLTPSNLLLRSLMRKFPEKTFFPFKYVVCLLDLNPCVIVSFVLFNVLRVVICIPFHYYVF